MMLLCFLGVGPFELALWTVLAIILYAVVKLIIYLIKRTMWAMPTRVPNGDYSFIDLEAPTLGAEVGKSRCGNALWQVWCEHCQQEHLHEPGEGNRDAHCSRVDSPYHQTGYNLALVAP